MLEFQDNIHRTSLTTELEIIKQKRVALQKLMKLTAMLNRLHNSLKSVILMGGSASQFPKSLLNQFNSFNQELKEQSTEVLKNTLLLTDQKIDRDIKYMLEISQRSESLLAQQLSSANSKPDEVLKVDYNEHVIHFKKKSQTSIALRIALASRNIFINTFKLPIPKAFIKKQIISLHHQEKRCLTAIKTDMSSLQQHVDSLITKEKCPQKFKELLTKVKSELEVNTEHLRAGKPIDEIPIVFETIELSATPQAVEAIETLAQHNQQTKSSKHKAETNSPIKNNLSFISHLWKWMNSSWKKKWNDIE